MAHDPKLEIYKLRLFTKADGRAVSFRKFFKKKYGISSSVTDKSLFDLFIKDFVLKIDTKSYHLNGKKKKGFTIAYDKVGKKNVSQITYSSKENIISGTIDGGKHDIKRWLGEIEDASKKTTINPNNIVCDRFYFLLYTPVDHNEAILLIQGYTEIKISDVFKDFLVEYFSFKKEIHCKAEIFIPLTLKEQYLEKATFKSARFSSNWSVNGGFDDLEQKEYELQVNIEIVDNSAEKSSYKKVYDLIKAFGPSIFKPEGGRQKKLEDFESIKAKMESSGKVFPIHLDNEEEIRPVILLKNVGVKIGEGAVPDFDDINAYCRELLTNIKKEYLPRNAVKEL